MVQDLFGPKATIVVHGGRWRGLVPREGGHVFAWFAETKLRPSAVTTSVVFGQTLESDADGNALVIGGSGDRLYSVDAEGMARCLGVFPDGTKLMSACWLPGGGVAAAFGSTICVYTADANGRLQPRARIEASHDEIYGLRCFGADPSSLTLAAMADDRGSIYAIVGDAPVRVLADFDGLDLAEVRLFIDETGYCTWLPDGLMLASAGDLLRVDGLDEAFERLDEFPLAPDSGERPPALAEGPDLPAPGSEVRLEAEVTVVSDALAPPALDRLGPLTAALIRLLRAGPARAAPEPELLKLIRADTPVDLRAYIHAWACYAPTNASVYEFWMGPPKLQTSARIRELAGDSVSLGTFASGEPIVARLVGSAACEVVMIDEEGIPYRYYGLEGFLSDLQMRTPDDWAWELDGV